MNINAQTGAFKVKEGSFMHIQAAYMDDKEDHRDKNNNPTALIKIITDNINETERKKLTFSGNRLTQISDKSYKTGQVWLYITAENSDFLEISHPEFGTVKFYFPESLCDWCTYEMVLQYIPVGSSIDVNSSPSGADVYLNDIHQGQTPLYIADVEPGVHELRISMKGCKPIEKIININKGETLTINERLQIGKDIKITTDREGDKLFVDEKFVGISPMTVNLAYGTHIVKVDRDGRIKSVTVNVSQNESDEDVNISFGDNLNIDVNGVTFTMIYVKGGTFRMGATSEQSNDAQTDEYPVHDVTLGDYYIGETEVTQKLWKAVMFDNPSNFKGDQKPVECVSWEDAQEFIKKLSQLTGFDFRLPTEAEWEYAARAGDNTVNRFTYSGTRYKIKLGDYAWYESNSKGKTHEVGTKKANAYGLYDMSGNVGEWCWNWHSLNYDVETEGGSDPTGTSAGDFRVVRGGAWAYASEISSVSSRGNMLPCDRYPDMGFRVVRSNVGWW